MTQLPLPAGRDDLNALWLTGALRGTCLLDHDETVTGVKCVQIGAEQGMTCWLFRAEMTTDKGAHKSVVAKIANADTREPMPGFFANELHFYDHMRCAAQPAAPCVRCDTGTVCCRNRQAQATAHVRVPASYWSSSSDDGSRFVLLLEDLEAAGFRPTNQVEGMSTEAATASLSEIARMHAKWWHTHPEFTACQTGVTSFKTSKEMRQLMQSMVGASWPGARGKLENRGVGVSGGSGFPSRSHADTLALLDDLATLFREGGGAVTQLTTLVHGDYRPDNILTSSNMPINTCAVDYQGTRWGRPTEDVSYFVAVRTQHARTHTNGHTNTYIYACTSQSLTFFRTRKCPNTQALPIAVRREHQEALLRAYHDELTCKGVVYLWEVFLADFHRDLLSNLAVTCLFATRLESAATVHSDRTLALTEKWLDRIIACFSDNDPRPTLAV